MTDDDIIDPNDPINTSEQEQKISENSSLNPIRPGEIPQNVKDKQESPKQPFFNQAAQNGYMYLQQQSNSSQQVGQKRQNNSVVCLVDESSSSSNNRSDLSQYTN